MFIDMDVQGTVCSRRATVAESFPCPGLTVCRISKLLRWPCGKCCLHPCSSLLPVWSWSINKLFSLEMAIVAKDTLLLVDTSEAGGMFLACMLCQFLISKVLELRHVQQEENLPFFQKKGGTSSAEEPFIYCSEPRGNKMCGELREEYSCSWSSTLGC